MSRTEALARIALGILLALPSSPLSARPQNPPTTATPDAKVPAPVVHSVEVAPETDVPCVFDGDGQLLIWASLDARKPTGERPPREVVPTTASEETTAALTVDIKIEGRTVATLDIQNGEQPPTPYRVPRGKKLTLRVHAKAPTPSRIPLHWVLLPADPRTTAIEYKVLRLNALLVVTNSSRDTIRTALQEVVDLVESTPGARYDFGVQRALKNLHYRVREQGLSTETEQERLLNLLIAHWRAYSAVTVPTQHNLSLDLAELLAGRGDYVRARQVCRDVDACLGSVDLRPPFGTLAELRIQAKFWLVLYTWLGVNDFERPLLVEAQHEARSVLEACSLDKGRFGATAASALLVYVNLLTHLGLASEVVDAGNTFHAIFPLGGDKDLSGLIDRELSLVQCLTVQALTTLGKGGEAINRCADITTELSELPNSSEFAWVPVHKWFARLLRARAQKSIGNREGAHEEFERLFSEIRPVTAVPGLASPESDPANPPSSTDEAVLKNQILSAAEEGKLETDPSEGAQIQLWNRKKLAHDKELQEGGGESPEAVWLGAFYDDRLRGSEDLAKTVRSLEAARQKCLDCLERADRDSGRWSDVRNRVEHYLVHAYQDRHEWDQAWKTGLDLLNRWPARSSVAIEDQQHLWMDLIKLSFQLQISKSGSALSAELTSELEAMRIRLLEDLLHHQIAFAHEVLFTATGQEAEQRSAQMGRVLSFAISAALGMEVGRPTDRVDALLFELSETIRAPRLASQIFLNQGLSELELQPLRKEIEDAQRARDALQYGLGVSEAERTEAERAVESKKAQLLKLVRTEQASQGRRISADVISLRDRLPKDSMVVAYRMYAQWVLQKDEFQKDGTMRDKLGEFLRDDRFCAFVLTPEKVSLVRLADQESVAEKIERWREAIGVAGDGDRAAGGSAPRGNPDSCAKRVLDAVYAPITNVRPETARHLILVLDDVLHRVPIENLPTGKREEIVEEQWRVVERRTTLLELFATSVAAGPPSFLAVGGVDYGPMPTAEQKAKARESQYPSPEGFGPLLHTKQEVVSVREAFQKHQEPGQDRSKILEGKGATRSHLKALVRGVKYLHFATHGWVLPGSRTFEEREEDDRDRRSTEWVSSESVGSGISPLGLCGLALSGANPPFDRMGWSECLLTGQDIADLDLSACELVVLSACSTGLGQMRRGQGTASVQTAVRLAGAQSALASLWDVNDASTAVLMRKFYEFYSWGGESKAAALRKAKQWMREQKTEGQVSYTPKDWAGWVLTGSPN